MKAADVDRYCAKAEAAKVRILHVDRIYIQMFLEKES